MAKASSLYGSGPQDLGLAVGRRNQYFRSLIIVCLIGFGGSQLLSSSEEYFELWLYSHIFMALGVIIFGFMHSIGILVVAFGGGLDLVLRYAVMTSCRSPSTAATLTKLTEDLVEIRFRKPAGFSYHPGQFVQLSGSRHWSFAVPSHHDQLGSEKDVTFHIVPWVVVATSSGVL
jgi:predicted ferric reductase